MRIDRYDLIAAVGLVALMVGLALFDWRYALVAFGVILLAVGVAGAALRPRVRR